jgi:hypothetical protein
MLGRTCCAGTFTAEKAADKAWRRLELKMEEGRSYDPRRDRQPSATTAAISLGMSAAASYDETERRLIHLPGCP